MKNHPLVAFLVIITLLSAGLIVLMKSLGQSGNYLAVPYMLGPAIAAVITRAMFYESKFMDANLRFGRVRDYIIFWAVALGITVLSFISFTFLGSITWDFSGRVFLDQLSQQMSLTGQDINDLPGGLTPQTMLIIYFIGGLTIFNVLPGMITGFGEEFGWRGFMFPQLYRIKPWVAFVIGGLIWYVWHIPLVLVIPSQTQDVTVTQTALNVLVLAISSICTHIFLSYVYVKSGSVFVASLAHITLDNVARSFAYFVILQNQLMANIGLSITMLIVVAILYVSKQMSVFDRYLNRNGSVEPINNLVTNVAD